MHHTVLPQECGTIRRRVSATHDLPGVVDGGRVTGGAAQRTEIGGDAVVPPEGVRISAAGQVRADDLSRIVHIPGVAVRTDQIDHEVIPSVGVAVAEPAIGYAVAVRILGREQKGATVGGPDDLPGVVDAIREAVAVVGSAKRAEVAHDAVLPEEGMRGAVTPAWV